MRDGRLEYVKTVFHSVLFKNGVKPEVLRNEK